MSEPREWAKALDFGGLSKAEARVKVAKDVQERLLGERLFPSVGYLGVFKGLDRPCHACAMGAVFVSSFGLFDGDVERSIRARFNYTGIDGFDITLATEGLFTEVQLRTIECAFEGELVACVFSVRRRDSIDSHGSLWREAIPDKLDRMYAIMQNIIDNNGTFKIEQVYEMETA